MRILLVEDDATLSRTLARGLRENAYAVDVAANGESAVQEATRHPYDAVILDVMLPGLDGFAVCARLRARDVHAPILMLTARDAVSDRVSGLDAGADDYLIKPFDFAELLARLRALLRRLGTVRPLQLVVGDLLVDTRRQQVSCADVTIALRPKEYALLEFLAQHAGQVVTRSTLCAHVWNSDHDPNSNSVDVHMGRLRRKLEHHNARVVLHTRRGVGYMLAAPDEPARQ